jgi:hypothetical protein
MPARKNYGINSSTKCLNTLRMMMQKRYRLSKKNRSVFRKEKKRRSSKNLPDS